VQFKYLCIWYNMYITRSTSKQRGVPGSSQTPIHWKLYAPLHFTLTSSSLVPRPPHPGFVTCSMKRGGRPGRIYHVPQLMSCSVCSHLGLFSPLHSSFPEFSSFFLFSLSCESNCYWIDRG